jgi:hypothetical protein
LAHEGFILTSILTEGTHVAKHRIETKSKLIPTTGTVAASIIASLLTVVAPTQATVSNDISLYLSAPFVQGSHVTGADVTFENFNNFTRGTCPASIQGASVTGCRIDAPAGHGGATADADNPNPVLGYHPSSNPTDTAQNRAGSDFITTYDSGGSVFPPITLTLSRSVKYVGFWWSAGSTNNTVQFFNGNTSIQTVTSNDITALLGPTSSTTSGLTITDVANRTQNSKEYFGHPKNRTLTTTQPFTYLNLFLSGVTADKIVFTGPGFEFDNLVTSTEEWGPTADMIFVSSSTGSTPVVSPQIVSWSPTNTSAPIDSTPLTPSAPAAVVTPASDGGPITYSVVDPGTTGCTVDPSTGVITRPAAGTCVVRATAAPVTSPTRLFSSFVDVSFTISAASSPPSFDSGSGSTAITSVPVVKADPCTAVATAAVNRKSRTFSGFAINSARLTPAMKRQIRTWLNKHPEEVCVSVAGFTMGPRVLPTDPKLAKDRARSVRSFIKSLRPDASFTPITSRTQRLVGDEVRRAKVTLRF